MALDANGLNADINGVVLSEEKMRDLGFTDHSPKNWYLCRGLGNDVTFNVSIPKDGSRLTLSVIDEDFGQHYDYQAILVRNPDFAFALAVKDKVEQVMEHLSSEGVIEGYVPGMYI